MNDAQESESFADISGESGPLELIWKSGGAPSDGIQSLLYSTSAKLPWTDGEAPLAPHQGGLYFRILSDPSPEDPGLILSDDLLSSKFPGKNGTSNQELTVAMWVAVNKANDMTEGQAAEVFFLAKGGSKVIDDLSSSGGRLLTTPAWFIRKPASTDDLTTDDLLAYDPLEAGAYQHLHGRLYFSDASYIDLYTPAVLQDREFLFLAMTYGQGRAKLYTGSPGGSLVVSAYGHGSGSADLATNDEPLTLGGIRNAYPTAQSGQGPGLTLDVGQPDPDFTDISYVLSASGVPNHLQTDGKPLMRCTRFPGNFAIPTYDNGKRPAIVVCQLTNYTSTDVPTELSPTLHPLLWGLCNRGYDVWVVSVPPARGGSTGNALSSGTYGSAYAGNGTSYAYAPQDGGHALWSTASISQPDPHPTKDPDWLMAWKALAMFTQAFFKSGGYADLTDVETSRVGIVGFGAGGETAYQVAYGPDLAIKMFGGTVDYVTQNTTSTRERYRAILTDASTMSFRAFAPTSNTSAFRWPAMLTNSVANYVLPGIKIGKNSAYQGTSYSPPYVELLKESSPAYVIDFFLTGSEKTSVLSNVRAHVSHSGYYGGSNFADFNARMSLYTTTAQAEAAFKSTFSGFPLKTETDLGTPSGGSILKKFYKDQGTLANLRFVAKDTNTYTQLDPTLAVALKADALITDSAELVEDQISWMNDVMEFHTQSSQGLLFNATHQAGYDEVCVFNTELSRDEILHLYRRGIASTLSGVIS